MNSWSGPTDLTLTSKFMTSISPYSGEYKRIFVVRAILILEVGYLLMSVFISPKIFV